MDRLIFENLSYLNEYLNELFVLLKEMLNKEIKHGYSKFSLIPKIFLEVKMWGNLILSIFWNTKNYYSYYEQC